MDGSTHSTTLQAAPTHTLLEGICFYQSSQSNTGYKYGSDGSMNPTKRDTKRLAHE